MWGSAVSSPAGSEAELHPKSNLVHFSLKICNLVATILVIFHWGNSSKVVCFSHNMRDFSLFRMVAWPTYPDDKTPVIANRGLLYAYFVYIIRGWIKLICRLGLSSSTNKLVCLFIFPFPHLRSRTPFNNPAERPGGLGRSRIWCN